jgi:twinkle protein
VATHGDDAMQTAVDLLRKYNIDLRRTHHGDSDAPGLALRADMVRLLGAARFHFVEWPEGIRDAGHMLLTDGAAALRDRVENGSLPWPVAGLYRMADLPEPAPLTLWDPGFPEWEGKVRLAPRTLSVKTGHPGHGKTMFATQMWFQVCRDYDVPICVASFESRAKPHLRRYLRTLHGGALEKDLTWQQIAAADAWINERYLFLTHPEQRPTLAWFLDTAETAVIRHGARVVVLDPWNRLESARGPREAETDYIGRCLRELHAFAHDLNVHVQILAHPAKMEGPRRGQAPSLEDISGSKNWDNAVDQGFVVHRPEVFDGVNRKTEATLYHRKARFDELGFPCKLGLNFDVQRGRYVSTDYDTGTYSTTPALAKGRRS